MLWCLGMYTMWHDEVLLNKPYCTALPTSSSSLNTAAYLLDTQLHKMINWFVLFCFFSMMMAAMSDMWGKSVSLNNFVLVFWARWKYSHGECKKKSRSIQSSIQSIEKNEGQARKDFTATGPPTPLSICTYYFCHQNPLWITMALFYSEGKTGAWAYISLPNSRGHREQRRIWGGELR